MIPGYAPIDAFILTILFFGKGKVNNNFEIIQGTDENGEQKLKKYELQGKSNLLKYNYEIWNSIFNISVMIFFINIAF